MKLENFTLHAAQRLHQRTKMNAYELNSMLSQGSTVDLGSKPGINKAHHLFYSPKDDAYFVAVLDSLVGSIVTIWLLEYHENLGWAVSEEEKQRAKELAESHEYKEIGKGDKKPKNYLISVGYLNDQNEIKIRGIGKVRVDEFEESDLWGFHDKTETINHLNREVAKKVDGSFQLVWVSFKLGRLGQLAAIDLTERGND